MNKIIATANYKNNLGTYVIESGIENDRRFIYVNTSTFSEMGFGMLLIELAKKDKYFREFMRRVSAEMDLIN